MVIRHFRRIRRVRREPGLKAQFKTAWRLGIFLEAQVFIENPDEVVREASFGQKSFPRSQNLFVGWAMMRALSVHASLGGVSREPVNKKRQALFDLHSRFVANLFARFGNVGKGYRHVTRLWR